MMRRHPADEPGWPEHSLDRPPAVTDSARFGPCHRAIHALACNAIRHANREGVDVAALIRRSGLNQTLPGLVPDRDAMRRQIDLVGMISVALGDESFAIRILSDLDFREIGLIYYVMASAGSLGQALRRLERYINAHEDGVVLRIRNQDPVVLTFHLSEMARVDDPYQILALIVLINDACLYLTGGAPVTASASLEIEVPAGKTHLERIISSEVKTGADGHQMELRAGSWWLPVSVAGAHSARRLLPRHQSGADGTVSAGVEEIVVDLLSRGLARHRIVAERLGVSARTLARRLAREGYEFSEILDRARFILAQRALADPVTPISRIARHTGYSEVAAFTRAFKRWSGMTPSAARRQL